jgi:hypothetical protein
MKCEFETRFQNGSSLKFVNSKCFVLLLKHLYVWYETISLFPKEITVHSGIVWRDKIYGDRHQICERVEVSAIKYQLFRLPKMKYPLFTLNI